MDVLKESNILTRFGRTLSCYTCRWLLLEMIVLFHHLEVLLEGEVWQGLFLSTRFFLCYYFHSYLFGYGQFIDNALDVHFTSLPAKLPSL